jgi:hypothetical protein
VCEFTLEGEDDNEKDKNESDEIKGMTGRTKVDSPFFIRY